MSSQNLSNKPSRIAAHAENHSFNTCLAIKYGVECAIVLGHIAFWIGVNRRNKVNFCDGKTWMYQSRKEMSAAMPYFTEDQVRRYTDKLCDEGVIIKGNYNKFAMDKTIWYAFADENISTKGESANLSCGESANLSCGESARAIPDTKKEAKSATENVLSSTLPSAAVVGPTLSDYKGFFSNTETPKDGPPDDFPEEFHPINEISEKELYREIIRTKKDWTGEEIAEAIKIIENRPEKVYDHIEFMGGIIDNIRLNKINKERKLEKKSKISHNSTKTAPPPNEERKIIRSDDPNLAKWDDVEREWKKKQSKKE